ncbi:MAG: hypothetical protein HY791_22855 [Deltaproteobacteria bacterium]|nr:hypothetical protein [Deltaproteobacteria bacterium]
MTENQDFTPIQSQDQTSATKRPFEEAKLTFVEPQLSQLGDVRDVTATFLISFTP